MSCGRPPRVALHLRPALRLGGWQASREAALCWRWDERWDATIPPSAPGCDASRSGSAVTQRGVGGWVSSRRPGIPMLSCKLGLAILLYVPKHVAAAIRGSGVGSGHDDRARVQDLGHRATLEVRALPWARDTLIATDEWLRGTRAAGRAMKSGGSNRRRCETCGRDRASPVPIINQAHAQDLS